MPSLNPWVEPPLRIGGSLQCRRGLIRPPSMTACRRHELARSKAIRPVRELGAAGTTVTFESVARAAGVSRSWLYTSPTSVTRSGGCATSAAGHPGRRCRHTADESA